MSNRDALIDGCWVLSLHPLYVCRKPRSLVYSQALRELQALRF